MQKGFLSTALIGEERRATRLFLSLFYLISIGYDIVYNLILPVMTGGIPRLGIVSSFSGIWLNGLLLCLLPIALYLMRIDKPQTVKYMYLYVYVCLSVIAEIVHYYGNAEQYHGGNIIELFLVLFTPIFVNKRFFWTVSCGMALKYAIVGIGIQYPLVLVPIALIIALSVVAYLLLNIFEGYVKSITASYSKQIDSIVKGIVAILELKDPYTRGHSERVAHYSLLLARKLNLYSEEELNSFYYSCLLHDVGKVNIPDHILTKPTSLTEEEYEVIKTHPCVGVEALKGIDGLQWSADVIKYHHERWDGKGYPEQLKERDIPLLARITTIADAYDAITTHRSYRPALPSDVAYERICQGSGKQFDPFLVNVFKEIYPVWIELASSFERRPDMHAFEQAETS
ncbi:HD-GYP domain-containing protein [Paenibacillus sp. MBLB4367]|uniref:HD-GYP domain-containing protein n=1 Tax=Paenibacillus sp. MBLB4367 TaxID=3384767 RepID=UPI003907F85B